VHDVRACEIADEVRSIGQLVDDRPEVFHPCRERQRPRRRRIDGHQVRRDIRVVAPGAEQPIRLDCLASENGERWGDERDAKCGHAISTMSAPDRFLQRRSAKALAERRPLALKARATSM
jgi:hypothetical protein